MEVDSLPPFWFDYRWSNNEGGVSMYGGVAGPTTQQRRAARYGALAIALFTPEKGVLGAPRASVYVQDAGCGDRCKTN